MYIYFLNVLPLWEVGQTRGSRGSGSLIFGIGKPSQSPWNREAKDNALTFAIAFNISFLPSPCSL